MMKQVLPSANSLPRFAESFRVLINHPRFDHRLVTGEWERANGWARCIADVVPHLVKAGRLGFIASTVPALEHGNEARYYGIANPPSIFWHWKNDAWQCQQTREWIVKYCAWRRLSVEVFDLPLGADVPWDLRQKAIAVSQGLA